MELHEENIRIIKSVFEYFNQHDWEKMAALYTDPAEFKDPSLGQEIVKKTRAQIVHKYRGLQEMSPDIRDDILQVYPSGDRHVIVEFVSSGTAPDGTQWTLPICTIFAIENGQVTKDFTYYDAN
jgi:ketosteroid isomerase-like protein